MDVKVGLGQQSLELGVLGFEFTQPLGIRGLHAAILGPPLVEGGVAEAALPAQLLDRQAGLGLPEKPDDLFCSSVNLLFFMSIILLVDGLPLDYAGTAGRGQVRKPRRSSQCAGFEFLELIPSQDQMFTTRFLKPFMRKIAKF
ncbi:UNVERIFIED_ORG: hypothetical protein HNP28_003219 [Comamonas terrigena]